MKTNQVQNEVQSVPFNFQAGTLASLSAILAKEAETVR